MDGLNPDSVLLKPLQHNNPHQIVCHCRQAHLIFQCAGIGRPGLFLFQIAFAVIKGFLICQPNLWQRLHASGMRDLLHRLGYEYKKPKCVPGNPDLEEQEIFAKQYEDFMAEKPEDIEVFSSMPRILSTMLRPPMDG